jgi:cyclase
MKQFLGVMLLLAASTSSAQYATSLESTEVAPGIFFIVGADGMAGGAITLLVGDDHVALIDDGYEPIAPALLEYVNELAGRPADFIINTHVHGDHTGANAAFAENGTVIFAHDNVRKRLVVDPAPAGGEGGLPVITFADGVTFYLNGIEARAFHVAHAHTDGDAAVDFPGTKVFHAGDLLFNGLFPYIDLDNGGSVAGIIKFQEWLIEHVDDDTIIIPGHGELASKDELRHNLMMITDSQARVKMLVDQGKTIDEVLSENPLSVYHDTYDWSFISTEIFTRMLYRSLTKGE